MEYTYEDVMHQVGRTRIGCIETFYSYAVNNKVVVQYDDTGVTFTIVGPDNKKVLGIARLQPFPEVV